MPWQVPIYDRTETDVKAKADKCYFSAAMLNRIEGNLAYLADLFGVTIQTKTWASTDFLTPSQMQRSLQTSKPCVMPTTHCPEHLKSRLSLPRGMPM